MIELAGIGLGAASYEAGKWVLGKVGGVAGDRATSLATAALASAASGPAADVLLGLELRPASKPLNHHIEQAYRLAELGALVLFVKALHERKLLPDDFHAGRHAERVIDDLSRRYRTVRGDRQAAVAEGLTLEHVRHTLMALDGDAQAAADASARLLREQLEDRALADLEITTGQVPSPPFQQLFRHGGDGLPAWFGLLAHNVVRVLVDKNMQQARQSLMLRLVARASASIEPKVDLDGLEQQLERLLAQQGSQVASLEAAFATLIGRLGDELGSTMTQVAGGLDTLAAQNASFGKAWSTGLAELDERLVAIEQLLREQAARLEEQLRLARGPVDEVGGGAAAPIDWSAAELPRVPPAVRPVGRDRELAALRAFLTDPAPALLQVSGRGGSGKSTLVAAVLHEQRDRPVVYVKVADGRPLLMPSLFDAFDVVLRAVEAPLLAADTGLATLQAKAQRLFEQFETRGLRAIVVLDSLDQALDRSSHRLVDADLEAFLCGCLGPQRALQLIVCAQAMPQVEHEGQLAPLGQTLFERQRQIELGTGLDDLDDCLALLRRRMAATRPDLQTGAEQVLRDLCHSVGGNPMALEHIAIALGRDRLASPQDLLDALRASTPGRGAVQQIRAALIGRVAAQLDAAERHLLETLAVLGGGASPETLMALAPGGPAAARPVLGDLLERHLVRGGGRSDLGLHDAEVAYYLSELPVPQLRQRSLEAAEHFARTGPPPDRWQTYGDADAALREVSLRVRAGDGVGAAAARLRTSQRLHDLGHVLGALQLLDTADEVERTTTDDRPRLLLLARCERRVGRFEAAQALCHGALAAPASGADDADRTLRLELRRLLGVCCLELGEAERAIAEQQRVLDDVDAAGAHGEPPGRRFELRGRTLIDLTFAESVVGLQPQALGHIAQAAELAGRASESGGPPQVLFVIAQALAGLVQSYCGDLAAAKAHYLEATRAAQAQPDLQARAMAYGQFAELELIEGRYDLAIDLATRSLQCAARTDAKSGSWCHWLLALALALHPDRLEEAELHARRACAHTRLLNDANPRALLGILLLRRGQRPAAVEHLEQALAVSNRLLRACARNWEAQAARGLTLLALATLGRATVEDAVDAYRAAHRASPYAGHALRVALQMRIAAPLLDAAGLESGETILGLLHDAPAPTP